MNQNVVDLITAQRELSEARGEYTRLIDQIGEQEKVVSYFGKEKAGKLESLQALVPDAKAKLEAANYKYLVAAEIIEQVNKREAIERIKQDWSAAGNSVTALTPEKLEELYKEQQSMQYQQNQNNARSNQANFILRNF